MGSKTSNWGGWGVGGMEGLSEAATKSRLEERKEPTGSQDLKRWGKGLWGGGCQKTSKTRNTNWNPKKSMPQKPQIDVHRTSQNFNDTRDSKYIKRSSKGPIYQNNVGSFLLFDQSYPVKFIYRVAGILTSKKKI